MSPGTSFNIAAAAAISAAYIALFYISDFLISRQELVGTVASLYFLPAFVRLLGYLIIGYWVIPALFLAALFCVDLGLDLEARLAISAFLAIGGPLGVAIAGWLCNLKPTVSNLSPARLLILSLGCAAGNSIFYNYGLEVVGHGGAGVNAKAAIFVGDLVGTWVVIYLIKAALATVRRSPRT